MARVQNAVYYDAVWLVAYGLRSLYASGTIAHRVDVHSLSALTLSDSMRAQAFVGMTGSISYDARNEGAANDRRGSDYALFNVLGMNAQCVWGTFVGANNLALQVDPNISLWRLPVFLGGDGAAVCHTFFNPTFHTMQSSGRVSLIVSKNVENLPRIILMMPDGFFSFFLSSPTPIGHGNRDARPPEQRVRAARGRADSARLVRGRHVCARQHDGRTGHRADKARSQCE